MIRAVIANVLSECFVLKAGADEYRVAQDAGETFQALVGCKKGDIVLVKVEGGKIVKVER